MKTKGVRYWTKKCDAIFSKIIRLRGKCEKCGSTSNLQTAHVIGRANKQVRFDPENCLCLCTKCHIFWAHREPIEFAEWVKEYLGEALYNALRFRALRTDKFDFESKYLELKGLYEEISKSK